MAYSVLIVDDDKRIREGLTRHIDWKSLDFDTPILASGGQEALEIFKYRKIDVLITDIRMPVMSGLELSEKVSGSYADTIIVILSGYNDFEYAKTAMRYGIKHYLTKPTDLDQFTKVLTDIKNDLETKNKQSTHMKDMEKRYNDAVKLLLEQFFVDLSNGAIKSEVTAHNFMSRNDIQFPFSYFNIIAVEITDFENTSINKLKYDSNQFSASLINMLKIILNDYSIIYYTYSTTSNIINIVLNFDNSINIKEICEKLYQYSKSLCGIETVLAVSNSVTSIWHISICNSQVQEILSYNQHNRAYGVIHYEEIKSKLMIEIGYPVDKERLLLSYLTNNDIYKAQNIIDSIFLPFSGYVDISREYLVKLLFSMESYLNNFNINIKDIDGKMQSPLKKSLEFHGNNDIIQWLKDYVNCVINYLNNTKQPYKYKFIEKAKEYIETNYMNDITLFSVSEAIYLTHLS